MYSRAKAFYGKDKDILDWEYYTDPITNMVFDYLVRIANHKCYKIDGKILNPGQCFIGRKRLAEMLRLSERQIRTALSHCVKSGVISTKATNSGTLVNIERYGIFPNVECQERPAIDQQSTSNRPQYNKNNNISNKEVINNIPSVSEIKTYISENRIRVDADDFYNYYLERGFPDDWKSKVSKWEQNAKRWGLKDKSIYKGTLCRSEGYPADFGTEYLREPDSGRVAAE